VTSSEKVLMEAQGFFPMGIGQELKRIGERVGEIRKD
jgi:hypothetical protein